MIRNAVTIVVLLAGIVLVGCSLDRTAGTATGSGNARTVALSGLVRDSAGKTLPHASVELCETHKFTGSGEHSFQAATDDSGRYVFPEVEQGTYHLLATARDSSLAAFQTGLDVDIESGNREVAEMIAYPSGKLTFSFDTSLLTDIDSLDAYLCGTPYRQRKYGHHSFYFGNIVGGDYKLIVIAHPEPTGIFVHSGICVTESLTVHAGETANPGMLECDRAAEAGNRFFVDDFERSGTRKGGYTDWKVWTHFPDTFDSNLNPAVICDHDDNENRMFEPGADGTNHCIHMKYYFENVGKIRNHALRSTFGGSDACEDLKSVRFWDFSEAQNVSFWIRGTGTPATVSLSLWSPFPDYGIVLHREGPIPETWTLLTFDLTNAPPSGTRVKLPRWQDQMNYAKAIEFIVAPLSEMEEGSWEGEVWIDEVVFRF